MSDDSVTPNAEMLQDYEEGEEFIRFFFKALADGVESAQDAHPTAVSQYFVDNYCKSEAELNEQLVQSLRHQSLRARILRRYDEAAYYERQRMELEDGADVIPDADNGYYYLLSVFLGASADERESVLCRWFEHQGQGWVEDNPHRVDDTICDSCAAPLAPKAVFGNGREVRCGACIKRNIGWWEEAGCDIDYFGMGVVEKAIENSARELDEWYKSNMMR